MADYYQQFSVMLVPPKGRLEDVRAWFRRVVDALWEYDEDTDTNSLDPDVNTLMKKFQASGDLESFCSVDLDPDSESIWLYEEESCNIGVVAEVVQLYFRTFDPTGELIIHWADTCSKMRTDGFGGGWVLIRADLLLWSPEPDQYEKELAARKVRVA